MTEDLGFLVEVYEEYSLRDPTDHKVIGKGHIKIGNYFMIDTNKENVEGRIRDQIPKSDKTYRIDIREVAPMIAGIYNLGRNKIDHID